MECCRRTGDRSFPLRLPVRASASADPGHRGDLPNTFRQLSSPNPTPIWRRLHLPRIGSRNSGRHIGTLSGVGSPHNRLASRLGRCYFSSVPSGLRVVSRPSPEHPAMTRMRRKRSLRNRHLGKTSPLRNNLSARPRPGQFADDLCVMSARFDSARQDVMMVRRIE